MKRYETLVGDVGRRIRSGELRPGDRLPSVRALCRTVASAAPPCCAPMKISKMSGLVESRPRSGFFVAAPKAPVRAAPPKLRSTSVAVSNLVFETLEASRDREIVPFGSAFPSPRYSRGPSSPATSAAAPDIWIPGAPWKVCRRETSSCVNKSRAATGVSG